MWFSVLQIYRSVGVADSTPLRRHFDMPLEPPERILFKPGRPKKPKAVPKGLTIEALAPKLFRNENGDQYEVLAKLPERSIDLVLSDYDGYYGLDGEDDNIDKWFERIEPLLKPGATVILFSRGASDLRTLLNSCESGGTARFRRKYTLVYEQYSHWETSAPNDEPLSWHENIVVFRDLNLNHKYYFDPQKWGEKELPPKSILPVYPMEKNGFHPTQKPVKTIEWLVKTYCPVGGTVLDNCMGAGTTGVACWNTRRAFIGIDWGEDASYFERSKRRIGLAVRNELDEELELRQITADEVTIPEVRSRFEAKEFITFYEGLNFEFMEYEEVCEVIVRYLNNYFAIVNGKDLTYVEWEWYIKDEDMFRSPFATDVLGNGNVKLNYQLRNTAEMKRRLMKCRMRNEDGKKIDVFDMWSRNVSTLEYADIVFDPTEDHDPETTLNTFGGLKVQNELRQMKGRVSMREYDEEAILPILEHLEALAGDDEVCYEYLLDWLAYPLQTGEKTNVALLIRGKPGCGKGVIFEKLMIKLIYGDALAAQLGGGKQIGNKFNAHWKNKMFIVIDEPNKLNRDQRDNLKNMIDSTITVIEDKGVSAKFDTDYTNYAFTCNHIPSEFLDHDDRRFFIIQHNGKNVQDQEHFKKLLSTIDQHYVDFYKYLMYRDIETFCKGEAPPTTFIKERLMLESVDPVFRYMRYLAEETEFCRRVRWLDFYKNAAKWCKEQHMPTTWHTKGALALRKIIQEKISENDLPTNKSAQGFPGCEGTSQRCIIFPPKDEFIQLLIDNQVYSKAEELEAEIKEEQDAMMIDYDELLCQEQERELERMKQQLEREDFGLGQDRFDHE